MDKIRVVKLKKENDFELQTYKVLIGEKEISNVKSIAASVDTKNLNITNIDIRIMTDDFEWINGESVKLSNDNPTD
jgi:hypothetical protein